MKWSTVALLVVVIAIAGCQLNPTVPKRPQSRIAFMTDRDGNFEIYLMGHDGSNIINLTDSANNEGLPSWSSKAKSFAFVNDGGGTGLFVERMNDKGEKQATLNNKLPVDTGPPVWSPTGEWVAFGSSNSGNAEVYIVDAAGENTINLTNHFAIDTFGAWSPDGKQIFFASDRDGTLVIYSVDISGGDALQITNPTVNSGRPVLSPNGSQMAFMSNQDGDIEIYVMDTHNGEMTRLTNSPGFDGFPAFSPDGRKIAFLSGRDENAEIYIMNSDGSDPINITNMPQSQESVQGDFAWSPNGEQIMFHTNRDGNVEIYVVNADGSNPTNLTNNPATDFASIWVP